jgi:hypothetical protein
MTLKEAYLTYRAYYYNNPWTGDDTRNYLKQNWIDYEEFNFEEFKNKILTDDNFNERWGKECTKDLDLKERFEIWESSKYKDVLEDFPIGPITDEQYHNIMDELEIPRRIIIESAENKKL